MANVKHKIMVLSGKGGVGKSTFAAQLSFALASMDYQVGLLDLDICGPSIPKMLGLEGQDIFRSNFGYSPVYVDYNLCVISIDFMISSSDHPVIWNGNSKTNHIKKFLKEVFWDKLDFLVVDTPPGTSDEQISIVQFLKASGIDGAIIVTSPQQVSMIDVRKGLNFCKRVDLKVLGVVENMSKLYQPLINFRFLRPSETDEEEHNDVTEWALQYIADHGPELLNLMACSEVFDSSSGGALRMCQEIGVPFLGRVPLDPQLCRAAEEGTSCFEDQRCRHSAGALKRILDNLLLKIVAQNEVTRKAGPTLNVVKGENDNKFIA